MKFLCAALWLVAFSIQLTRGEISLELTAGPARDPLVSGAPFSYRISVLNKGDSAASLVTLTNRISPALEVRSVVFVADNLPATWESPEPGLVYVRASKLEPSAKLVFDLHLSAPSGLSPVIYSGTVFSIEEEQTKWDNHLTLQSDVLPPVENEPPRVNILSGLSNANLSFGSDLRVEIEAVDDGRVARVDMVIDDVLVQSRENAPYQFFWPKLAHGTHRVKFRAFDSYGAFTFTESITISVSTPETPRLLMPKVENGKFKMVAALDREAGWLIQASNNDGLWNEVARLNAGYLSAEIVDNRPGQRRWQIFRAVRVER